MKVLPQEKIGPYLSEAEKRDAADTIGNVISQAM